MDELMLDGNAVAGMLGEVFAVEMTTATATCRNCGEPAAVGAMHLFRGAGIVLRYPHCDSALASPHIPDPGSPGGAGREASSQIPAAADPARAVGGDGRYRERGARARRPVAVGVRRGECQRTGRGFDA